MAKVGSIVLAGFNQPEVRDEKRNVPGNNPSSASRVHIR